MERAEAGQLAVAHTLCLLSVALCAPLCESAPGCWVRVGCEGWPTPGTGCARGGRGRVVGVLSLSEQASQMLESSDTAAGRGRVQTARGVSHRRQGERAPPLARVVVRLLGSVYKSVTTSVYAP